MSLGAGQGEKPEVDRRPPSPVPVEYWRAGEPTGELTVPWWYYVCLGTTLGWVVLMCAGFFGAPLGRLELAWPVLSMLSFMTAVYTFHGPPCPEPQRNVAIFVSIISGLDMVCVLGAMMFWWSWR